MYNSLSSKINKNKMPILCLCYSILIHQVLDIVSMDIDIKVMQSISIHLQVAILFMTGKLIAISYA